MTINNAYRFIFGDTSSDELDIIICSIGSPSTDSNDEKSSIITSKTATQRRFDLHAVQYDEPLRFSITVANPDGKFLDAIDERKIKKKLCKTERQWLNIDQDDLLNISYFCLMSNPRKDSIAKKTGGITFDVECDFGGAWSSLSKKIYTSSSTLTFAFPFVSDFENDTLCPVINITPLANGNISILNSTTNKEMIINNCISTEVITFDNENNIFESTSGRVLLDDWNKVFLEFVEGTNTVTLTGNFKLEMSYRLPIRIGG